MLTDQPQHHGMPLVTAQSSTPRRAISVRGDTVIKIQDPIASRRERLRTQAGRDVGLKTGLFSVPEIVSFDDARGEIVFQRFNLTAIRQALSDPSRSMDLAGRAAQALAAIHGHMKVGDDPARGSVPLHGDFGMRNVFYLADSDRLAIIDWMNADWIGFDGDIGAPEIDVAVFLISLFHRRVFGPWPVSRRHEVARHFLSTYTSGSPHGLDPERLKAIIAATVPAFTQMTRRRKGSLHALACRPAMLDLDFFLRRLSTTG